MRCELYVGRQNGMVTTCSSTTRLSARPSPPPPTMSLLPHPFQSSLGAFFKLRRPPFLHKSLRRPLLTPDHHHHPVPPSLLPSSPFRPSSFSPSAFAIAFYLPNQPPTMHRVALRSAAVFATRSAVPKDRRSHLCARARPLLSNFSLPAFTL